MTDTEDEFRWQAILRRDRQQDTHFVYAVRSTGIYCRPSCPARRPQRHNIRFFDKPQQAQTAGFRPCKRCTPDQTDRTHLAIIAACRAMETSDTIPRLDDLAERAGLSPSRFHRAFKAVLGITPWAYAQEHRAKRLRQHLTTAPSVTDALYAAGYNASSRFYEQSDSVLGMTPTEFRAGGADTRLHFAIGQTSLGAVLVASGRRGICAILLGDDPDILLRDLQNRFPQAELVGGDPGYDHHVAAIIQCVEHPSIPPDLPLDIRGTAFQQRVWQALRDIPPGTTATYQEIAQRLGLPKAARAVAGACAANSLAVVVPCHRVVRTDGSLSGYRWGVERKRQLLEREKRR